MFTEDHQFPHRLDGRAVVVTGASSGIGRAIAVRLGREGAAVTCCDLAADPRRGGAGGEPELATHDLIRHFGGMATFERCDVADEADVERAFSALNRGPARPWGAVLAAGIFARDVSILDETVDEHDRTMAVNERGVWLSIRAAARLLRGQPEGGRIIAVASISGLVGLADEPSYCASKGAVVNLARAAALDLAPHAITVNAVCPGFVATAMLADDLSDPVRRRRLETSVPLGRIGSTDDVSAAVAYLMSPEAGFVTGVALPVDGGYTCG